MTEILRTASAGTDTSGDALVTVTPGAGKLELNIKSVFYAQFSSAIETSARKLLAELGVENARVEIDDHGALDWTLRARIETAVLRGKGE